MGYHGEDLDLRTPQGWGPAGDESKTGEVQANGWWTRSTIYAGGRADPLWVDGVVLDCCNHAFDLARAHRAGEVRLEHLLHAITLNEAAAIILEQRGFRVLTLRRESSQRLAAEGPIGSSIAIPPTPKKSRDFEEALRRAADYAYPNRTPITVDAILHVLTVITTGSPGAQMLIACGPDHSKREAPETRAEVATRSPRTTPEPQHFGVQHTRDERPLPYYVREPLSPTPRYVAPATPDGMAEMRLAHLERMVGEVLGSFFGQRQVEAARPSLPASEGLLEQLNAIERRLEQMAEISRTPTQSSEQLRQIERSLADLAAKGQESPKLLQALAAWESRLAELERTGTVVLDRLTGVERNIETRLDAASHGVPLEPGEAPADLPQRLASIERVLQNLTTIDSLREHLSHLAQAMDEHDAQQEHLLAGKFDELRAGLERAAGYRLAGSGTTAEQGTGGEPNLLEMQDALLKLSTNQAAIAEALEQWRLDNTGDLAVIGNRMQALETLLTRGWLSAGLDNAGRLQRWLSRNAKQGAGGKSAANAERAPWRKRRLMQSVRGGQNAAGEAGPRSPKGSSTTGE